MSVWAPSPSGVLKGFTANLAQAAGTYDLATATGGDVIVDWVIVYVATGGATFTSVSIQTNDTTPVSVLSAAEGAIANVTVGKNLKVFSTPMFVASTKKLQYTIVGVTGTGTLTVAVMSRPIVAGVLV